MSYDFYAKMHGESKEDVNAVVKGNWCDTQITDIAARIQILTGIAASGAKDYAVSGDRRNGGGYKSLVHHEQPRNSPYAQKLIQPEWQRLDKLGLLKPAKPNMDLLPFGAMFLQFDFTLAAPYLSKDDEPFYMSESVNSVRKDKVFKIPMIAASSWKGSLRWSTTQTHLVSTAQDLSEEEFASKRLSLTRIFGEEKGEEWDNPDDLAKLLNELKPEAIQPYRQMIRQHFAVDEQEIMPHHRGRLLCYPTFFDLIDIEVINPHSRKTKAGTLPIYLESVPAGATGIFTLLYVPFDRIGEDAAETRRQVAADLKLVVEGVQAMLTLYGFGAKTSSGFGLAKEKLVGDGQLSIRALQISGAIPPTSAAKDEPALPRYLVAVGKLKPEYLNPDGTFRQRSPADLKAIKKSEGQEYDRAKKWWEREGKMLAEREPEPASVSIAPPAPTWPLCSFADFTALVSLTAQVAQQLTQEDAS